MEPEKTQNTQDYGEEQKKQEKIVRESEVMALFDHGGAFDSGVVM